MEGSRGYHRELPVRGEGGGKTLRGKAGAGSMGRRGAGGREKRREGEGLKWRADI